MNSPLLSTPEAAEYMKVARQTLAIWRLNGKGPTFKKIGSKVYYELAALDLFLSKRTFKSTAEYKMV